MGKWVCFNELGELKNTGNIFVTRVFQPLPKLLKLSIVPITPITLPHPTLSGIKKDTYKQEGGR